MTEQPPTSNSDPGEPKPGDIVELIDGGTRRIMGVVEEAGPEGCVVRLDGPPPATDAATVRWFDGEQGWQSIFELDASGAPRVELMPQTAWMPAGTRSSERIATDRAPLLVEIIASRSIPAGRRLDLVCLDVSATGCRASCPGRAPYPGDVVKVSWTKGDWETGKQPEWVPARVMRTETLPFRGAHVGFRFDPNDETDAARIRAWRDEWAGAQRARLAPHAPAVPNRDVA